ncbi:hypothetical protein A1353_11380 [Methylomonas methanica]|uniref:Uncharacterized protein n=1 Tax=Methylomonas methanica TaxID=421 RepID=A0A177MJF7_METMH|nr:hypothetical protein A1353_11380 [Methylomonas methanica]
MPLVFGGLRIALPKTLAKPFGAQDQSGIRAAFLLGTFLWRSKEKYLAFGGETPIKTTRRDIETNFQA